MTGVRGRGLQSCVLRAVHSHAAVCRTAAADIRDAYPVIHWAAPAAVWVMANIASGTASSTHIAQFPISPNNGEYRPIPNTPIPVSFEPYSTVYTKNNVKYSTVVVHTAVLQPALKYRKKINSWRQWCISRIYATVMSVDWTNNKVWRVWWGAPCWWGAWGPGPLPPPKSGPALFMPISYLIISLILTLVVMFRRVVQFHPPKTSVLITEGSAGFGAVRVPGADGWARFRSRHRKEP